MGNIRVRAWQAFADYRASRTSEIISFSTDPSSPQQAIRGSVIFTFTDICSKTTRLRALSLFGDFFLLEMGPFMRRVSDNLSYNATNNRIINTPEFHVNIGQNIIFVGK